MCLGFIQVSDNEKKCRFHPDVAAKVFCDKLEYGYCEYCLESCIACSDPELYCRHRTYCIIWELCRKTVRMRDKEP
jgi:hypothetical protein